MLLALLIAFQIAQVSDDFVRFDVCYLDTRSSPWEFRPHPEGEDFYARANQVIFVAPVAFNVEGLDCVRTCSAWGCRYVVGTVASVMETIRGTGNAGEKEGQ